MTVDLSSVRLGKLEPRQDDRTLKLANYVDLAAVMPSVPKTYRWGPLVRSWPMFANDRLGDCVFAWIGHHVELLTAAGRAEATITDADVIGMYSKVTGYDPTTGAHDNGAVLLDALNAWRHDGLAGHRIGAFVGIDPGHRDQLLAGAYLLGGLGIGLGLPRAAQRMGARWQLATRHSGPDWQPYSWGGHAVYVVDYDHTGLWVVSWGELIFMTWGFWHAYCDEAWAVLSPDFLRPDGTSTQGFDTAALQSDLSQLGAVH